VMFLWLFRSSRNKWAIIAVAVAGAILLPQVMPESWFNRMHTIETYQQDSSVGGRFDAWTFAYRLAMQRPFTGGGFHIYSDTPLFLHLVPTAPSTHAFHSIYFEALGEHGFIGLAIFVGVIVAGFVQTAKLRRLTRNDPARVWAFDLASMIQV